MGRREDVDLAEIRLGTSGWPYRHRVGRFYPDHWPASKMLGYYQERFDTVEVNHSFYKSSSAEAMEEWRSSTPDGFCFAKPMSIPTGTASVLYSCTTIRTSAPASWLLQHNRLKAAGCGRG